MVDIIRLHGDPHKQTQTLLPWYAKGTLEPQDLDAVEAHLEDCAECRADLEYERVLGREISGLPTDEERGWAALRSRLEAQTAAPTRTRWLSPRRILRRPVPLGWAIAAQAAAVAIVALVALVSTTPPRDAYRTLSAPAGGTAGNVVVMFTPATTERELRGALSAANARLVDGPTTSDAYVLQVPADRREAALGKLRADPHIKLAEPIDGDSRP